MKKRKLWVSVVAGVLAALMLLSLVFSVLPQPVSAVSSKEIRNQINDLKEKKEELLSQMEEIQDQVEENEGEIADTVDQKNLVDQEIFLLHEQIDNINQQLSAYALLIADKQDELDAAEAHLEELNENNKDRVRAMEEEGDLSYWAVLFKASDFTDLLDRLSMIEEIAEADQRRLEEMSRAAEEVANAQSELAAEKEELEATKTELDATQVILEEKQAQSQALLNELIERGEELEALHEEYEQEKLDLQDEIAQKEKEYNQAKAAENAAAAPSGGGGGAAGGSGGSSGWLVPCSYTMVTSPFGNRDQPTAGASTNHKGVDLAAPAGTPIYASRGGTVTIATHSRSAGYYVSINHGDGYSSVYMHMTRYVVSKGQTVSAGQLIGYVGSTGISSGNHLHFGISYNGTYVNPMQFI